MEWAASAESRGILFLGDSTRELSEALKGDDRMRTTVTGEAVQQSRMSQGSGPQNQLKQLPVVVVHRVFVLIYPETR